MSLHRFLPPPPPLRLRVRPSSPHRRRPPTSRHRGQEARSPTCDACAEVTARSADRRGDGRTDGRTAPRCSARHCPSPHRAVRPQPRSAGMPEGGGGGRGGGLSPLRPHEGRGKKQITTTIPPPNLEEMSRKGATFAFLSKTQRGQNPPAPARLSLQSAVRCNLPNG